MLYGLGIYNFFAHIICTIKEADFHFLFLSAVMKQSKHDLLKNRIRRNPDLIGLEGVIASEEEVPCYDENGKLVCCPDIAFYLENDVFVLVEVKSSNHKRALQKLERQLETGYEYFRDNYQKEARCIGVYLEKSGKIRWYELN